MHVTHPAPQDGGSKADKIADHAAAKRDDDAVAFDPLGQQPFHGLFKMRPALGRLTGRQGQRLRGDAFGGEATRQGRKVGACDIGVGDDRDAFPAEERGDFKPGARDQPRGDLHVVGAGVERHVNGVGGHPVCSSTSGRFRSALITSRVISSMEYLLSASTAMSASA